MQENSAHVVGVPFMTVPMRISMTMKIRPALGGVRPLVVLVMHKTIVWGDGRSDIPSVNRE